MDEVTYEEILILMQAVVEHVAAAAGAQTPDDYVVNRVIEIDASSRIKDYPLPA